ncbi:MAG: 50S ribosomal protein L11 methyltransferase [Alistipes sp.]|nr:50S ribosomal protein L11 methyltransferase [Alistipes sp.]
MRHYIELRIESSDEEMAEIVTAFLSDYPFETFSSQPTDNGVTLSGYILHKEWQECRDEALTAIADYGTVVSETEIESQNWNATWEAESFNPVEVELCDGRTMVIRAPHHPMPNADTVDIIVSPQMSFGSGHHHTTRMMCRNIATIGELGRTLDVGCGTGVLSIAALKLGAESVDAVDIDPWSTKSAEEAAELNGLKEKMDILLGTVETVEGRTYDTILANINRNIILADIDSYVKALNNAGHLIVSGFLRSDVEAIESACRERGLSLVSELEEEEWVSLKFVNRE